MIYGDAKMDTRQSLADKVRNSFTEVKDSLREYVAMPAVKYIILPASLAVGGAALEEGVINTSNAYAQTAPNERSTISQVTASPERKELSDLVASPTLNGPDTALLSWTQPDGEFKDYEVQVGKQSYKFSSNDVEEKDGKKQVLLGQVEGKNGETLDVQLTGNGYSTVIDGKATITKAEVYRVLEIGKEIEKNNYGSGDLYRFKIEPALHKQKLWGFAEAINKVGGVQVVYNDDMSGSRDDIHLIGDAAYEIERHYIARHLFNTEFMPDVINEIFLRPYNTYGQDQNGGKITRVVISSSDLLPSEFSSLHPESKTVVSPSTWGQIKSQFK